MADLTINHQLVTLTLVRQAIWPYLPREMQTEIAPKLAAVARELERVDELRVRAVAAENMVRSMQASERLVPRRYRGEDGVGG